ncbi:MAG: hypothetical protein JXR91_02235 [Deltaproteobacteria bacterium]|nr:hypothetical protein [Deltaproteobacteria bacterium]
MGNKKENDSNLLVEKMVRNDDIFCGLLYDEQNSTLRVVDFRGGNFQQKQDYLRRIQLAEGFRKIYTLIERDDMQGWQRVGYMKEASIPGYYRRSDAYLMGWIADENWIPEDLEDDDSDERRDYIAKVKDMATLFESYKSAGLKTENITPEEIPTLLINEIKRQSAKTKGPLKAKQSDFPIPTEDTPMFMQFSRDVEYYYFSAANKRTEQINILIAEYQDCFGNAKIDIYFDKVKTKTEIAMVRLALDEFVKWLGEIGAVAIFAMVDVDNIELNAVYASCGFKNSGWLHQQAVKDGKVKDQILWTFKHFV